MTDEERIKLKEKMRAKARAEAEKEMLENNLSEEEILYQQMLEEERQKLQNGGTSVCPFCGSIIPSQAIVCPVCRMRLTNTPQVVVSNDGGEGYATASLGLYFGIMYLANHAETSTLVDVTLSNGTVVKGVHSDFKEIMDSYEEWAIKFRDVTKSVNSSDLDSISAYNEMLKEQQEWTIKLNKYKEDTLSEADYLYYVDVSTRVLRMLAGNEDESDS